MDYLIKAMDSTKMVRVSAINAKDVVEKARQIHNTSKTASAAFGRTLCAGLLMASDLKNEDDSLTLNIESESSIGRIVVTCKNDGNVKGYVKNPMADAEIRESDHKLDVRAIVGNGTLTVVKDLGLKQPYVGKVNLVSGEIAEDIANYYYISEQVRSVVSLGVLVDKDYTIKQAGGFILQLMPYAGEEVIEKIENNLKDLPSYTEMLEGNMSLEDIINRLLEGFEVNYLDKKPVHYKCDCSREKVISSLISLGKKELEDIKEEEENVEVICHFCNTEYKFNKEDIDEIIKMI